MLVTVRCLGPLTVSIGSKPIPVGGPRPRGLITLLALNAGTPLPTDRLVDLLWDGEPPDTARNAVQVYVSRLRRALAATGGRSPLRAAGGGYLLEIDPDGVDALRFERLVAEGRAQRAAGELPRAASTLAEARDLWRGEAAPDLRTNATAAALLAKLDASRLAAEAERIDIELALGRPEAVLPELAELTQQHPLDERLASQLLTALYRVGRQGEALEAYARLARRLADELGADPGPDLRRLHERLLRHELNEPGDPKAAAPADRPAMAAPAAPAGDPLIGRADETTQVLDLLRTGARLITLVGPGGVGKTRLARHLAEQALGLRPIFLELASVEDPAEVGAELCRALGLTTWPDSAAAAAARALAGRAATREPALVVLDNLEQLIAPPCLQLITDLLARAPQVRVLVTSRTVLRLAGEQVIHLAPLPVPPADADPERIAAAPAVQLFQRRAAAALGRFPLTEANAADVAQVCRALDGLPLALELAAARISVLPPATLLQRMDQSLSLLAGGARDVPPRQRSLRAALDWSAHLLEPDEAAVFAQVSVFAGGWTLAAAEAVCRTEQSSVLDALAGLAEKSLITADGTGRLHLLGIIREYAAERLAALGAEQVRQVRQRHAEYLASLAERHGPACRDAPDLRAARVLDAEAANFAAALTHAEVEQHGDLLGRIVVALLDYWFFFGRAREVDRWLRAALAGAAPTALRGRLLHSAASLALISGDLDRAEPLLRAAECAAAEVGDQLSRVRALSGSAIVARYRGDSARALVLLDESLQAAEAAGLDPGAFGHLINERGELLAELGRETEAQREFERFRLAAQRDDNLGNLAYALANLAGAAARTERPAAARELADQARRAAHAADAPAVLADVLTVVGLIELTCGSPATATAELHQAVRHGNATGLLTTMTQTVALLGAAHTIAGDPLTGARWLATAAGWREERGLRVVGPLARRTVAAAERRVAAELTAQELDAATAAGRAVPFGVVPEPPRRVLDLRDSARVA